MTTGPVESKREIGAVANARLTPHNCPHCAYDRQFPETACGGWIYQGNNGPIVSCPMCNPNGMYNPNARFYRR